MKASQRINWMNDMQKSLLKTQTSPVEKTPYSLNLDGNGKKDPTSIFLKIHELLLLDNNYPEPECIQVYTDDSKNAPPYRTKVAEKHPKASDVDNCLTGVQRIEDIELFVTGSKELMTSAGFNLRCWISNTSNKGSENILRLFWQYFIGALGYFVSVITCAELLARIVRLSLTQRIFDSISLTDSVSLIPKLFL
ncbi:hypothetical protein NPIL_623321 [Nephila pilipes]|uniref:Uncharacterized protein n=1 Tax=Nephila pilipes TaxID=299642 RepID=A0A8X6PIL4_NEPPI|nr:hypothetical protein NPIL_623321 [Nephila pilipes]